MAASNGLDDERRRLNGGDDRAAGISRVHVVYFTISHIASPLLMAYYVWRAKWVLQMVLTTRDDA